MVILFPVEIASRELLFKCYLSMQFAKRGHICYVGSKRSIQLAIQSCKSFVYFDKGFHLGVSELMHEKIKAKGGLIVSLDEEGAVDFEDDSTILSRYHDKLFEKADLVFFWGEYQKRLIQESRLKKTSCFVSGHPRFELLKPAFHGFYKEDIEDIKNRFGRFILINTNMGFGNNLRGDSFVVENYGKRFKNIESLIAQDKLKISKYQSLIRRLALHYDYNIIVRPHPEENLETYVKEFETFDNVKVLFEKSAVPWLIACEQMIHMDCTTGIESLMVGKKAISYLPKCLKEELLTLLPIKASIRTSTEDEVIQYINTKISSVDSIQSEPFEWLEERFAFNLNSSEIIVEAVNEFISSVDDSSDGQLNSRQISNHKAKELLRKFLGRKNVLVNSKLNGMNKSEVEKIKSLVIKGDRFMKDIEFQTLLNDLYCFRLDKSVAEK